MMLEFTFAVFLGSYHLWQPYDKKGHSGSFQSEGTLVQKDG